MKCINHPETEAAAICIACGHPICEICRVVFKGENYCKNCLAKKSGEAAEQKRSPALAGVLSFFIAGAGQVYNGQIGKGIFIFLTAWLFIPWIYGIFDAYSAAKKINEGRIKTKERPGCVIALVVGVVLIIPALAIFGMLAAIAIPNFMRAREEARANSCVANLLIIRQAKERYRIDNGLNYNDSIPPADINEVYDGDGIPDALETHIDGQIVCPGGGHYEIGKFGETPRCSIGTNETPADYDDHILR